MNDLSQILSAGTMLIIETGEYSNASWSGPVRMLKSASKADLVDAFREQWKPDEWHDEPGPDHFMPWLISAGWAEAVDNITSWHVGSYGEFEP